MTKIQSFAPVIGPGARVLILGSMPGGESLRMGQYYAIRRNAFWDVMEAFCGAGFGLDYERRKERLVRAKVALWDVLKFCERQGSLDANIKVDTEAPHEIGALLEAHPTIGAILFNGAKAERAFGRHVLPGLGDDLRSRLRMERMPSTSPANAQMRKGEKVRIWLDALERAVNPTM